MKLLLIFIAGFLLRLWQLKELFYFTHDEETIVWRVMPLLRGHNLFLLGGVTPFHVHLGPWYYYLSAIILWLSKLDPIGWGIAAAIFSLATMFFLYKLSHSLIPIYFYAFSFFMIILDRHWWPLYFGPLLSLLTIFCLLKRVYIPLFAILAFAFHTDPSNWGLIFLAFVSFVIFRIKINRPFIFGLILFFLSFLPLFAFDINNQGKNISGVNQYLTETKPNQGWSFSRFVEVFLFVPRTLSRLIYNPITDLSQNYSYCPQYSDNRIKSVPLPFLLFSIIVLLWFFIKPAKSQLASLVKIYFLIIFAGINLYGNFFVSDLFDHYLTTLFPLFFLILASFLKLLPKIITVILLFLFLTINLFSFSKISNQFSYKDKLQAITWVKSNLSGKPFTLDVVGDCFRYAGLRYLFTFQGIEPSQSYVDSNFFWLYQQPPALIKPETAVVFEIPYTLTNNLTNIISQNTFGAIKVLIRR